MTDASTPRRTVTAADFRKAEAALRRGDKDAAARALEGLLGGEDSDAGLALARCLATWDGARPLENLVRRSVANAAVSRHRRLARAVPLQSPLVPDEPGPNVGAEVGGWAVAVMYVAPCLERFASAYPERRNDAVRMSATMVATMAEGLCNDPDSFAPRWARSAISKAVMG